MFFSLIVVFSLNTENILYISRQIKEYIHMFSLEKMRLLTYWFPFIQTIYSRCYISKAPKSLGRSSGNLRGRWYRSILLGINGLITHLPFPLFWKAIVYLYTKEK